MKKRILSILISSALVFSLIACSEKIETPAEPNAQRSLSIIWPTLSIDFYSAMADMMRDQAENAGWRVGVQSFDFDSAVQAAQLESCSASGITDIITCAPDPDAVEDICIRLRQEGINISFFAFAPDNPDAYDSVTVADQYQIGAAIAKNASDWVEETFPNAEDGSIGTIIIEVPTDDENIKRAQGMEETILKNPKINVAYICKLSGENPEEAQKVIDTMMQTYPETRVILCHFSSLALAADDAAKGYGQIDRKHTGIFSGDWDTELASRIQASEDDKSLIRATGTYATDAMEIQFHVCSGEYSLMLNEKKQYVYPVVRITPKNIEDYLL